MRNERDFKPGMANIFESACPNFLCISKKSFRIPMGILESTIRSWSLPQLLLITALLLLLLLMHILINA
jgi:hypothetical protein